MSGESREPTGQPMTDAEQRALEQLAALYPPGRSLYSFSREDLSSGAWRTILDEAKAAAAAADAPEPTPWWEIDLTTPSSPAALIGAGGPGEPAAVDDEPWVFLHGTAGSGDSVELHPNHASACRAAAVWAIEEGLGSDQTSATLFESGRYADVVARWRALRPGELLELRPVSASTPRGAQPSR
jgi:hypothetical protein